MEDEKHEAENTGQGVMVMYSAYWHDTEYELTMTSSNLTHFPKTASLFFTHTMPTNDYITDMGDWLLHKHEFIPSLGLPD